MQSPVMLNPSDSAEDLSRLFTNMMCFFHDPDLSVGLHDIRPVAVCLENFINPRGFV